MCKKRSKIVIILLISFILSVGSLESQAQILPSGSQTKLSNIFESLLMSPILELLPIGSGFGAAPQPITASLVDSPLAGLLSPALGNNNGKGEYDQFDIGANYISQMPFITTKPLTMMPPNLTGSFLPFSPLGPFSLMSELFLPPFAYSPYFQPPSFLDQRGYKALGPVEGEYWNGKQVYAYMPEGVNHEDYPDRELINMMIFGVPLIQIPLGDSAKQDVLQKVLPISMSWGDPLFGFGIPFCARAKVI